MKAGLLAILGRGRWDLTISPHRGCLVPDVLFLLFYPHGVCETRRSKYGVVAAFCSLFRSFLCFFSLKGFRRQPLR